MNAGAPPSRRPSRDPRKPRVAGLRHARVSSHQGATGGQDQVGSRAEARLGRTAWPTVTRWLPLAIASSALLLVLAAVVAVDVAFGLDGMEWPLWYHLYQEGGPVELMQWLLLLAGALLASATAGRTCGVEQRVSGAFAAGLALLAIEDAGNPSHLFRVYLDTAWARLPVFLLLAGIMLAVLPGLWNLGSRGYNTRTPLVIGYFAYGSAALLSQSYVVVPDSYPILGDWILDRIFAGELAPLPEAIWGSDTVAEATSIVFMDSLVEESIELLAAGLLCTVSWRLLTGSRSAASASGGVG